MIEKKGLIITEKDIENWDWAKSHASVPTVLEFDNFYRLYFSPRNSLGQSIPVYVDLDLDFKIIKYGSQIINLGEIGTFDDGGIMPCSVVRVEEQIYMYYVGWNPTISVPYRNSIGLCVSEDGGKTFKRIHKGPIVDRTIYEPFFTASPFVLKEDNIFKMWYASSTGFMKTENEYSPLYHIKYAESKDGITWVRKNISCIEPNYYGECTARPSVFFENNVYKMYYCYRGSLDYRDGHDSYIIGYAESTNGIDWVRMDNLVGLDKSEEGWDSKMMSYPFYLNHNDKKYLFYNGNGFGKTGIGYAEIIKK